MIITVPLWFVLALLVVQVAIVAGFGFVVHRERQKPAALPDQQPEPQPKHPEFGSGGYQAQPNCAPLEPDREHHLVRICASEVPTVHVNRSSSALMAKREPAICVTCRQAWPEPKEPA